MIFLGFIIPKVLCSVFFLVSNSSIDLSKKLSRIFFLSAQSLADNSPVIFIEESSILWLSHLLNLSVVGVISASIHVNLLNFCSGFRFRNLTGNNLTQFPFLVIPPTQTTLNEIITGEKYKTPLEKIPYWMGYNFYCDDTRCNGHNMMCEDWEVLELFRRMKQKYG